MQYLYHMVPRDLEGMVLYPLNELKYRHPELYRQHLEKYTGREHILRQHIPTLNNCRRNEVLMLSPVSPEHIFAALYEEGVAVERPWRFFKVDPYDLHRSATTVWLHQSHFEDANGYRPYEPCTLEQYSKLPESTIEHYRTMAALGVKPFIFVNIPHVLYRGTLDISNVERIEI